MKLFPFVHVNLRERKVTSHLDDGSSVHPARRYRPSSSSTLLDVDGKQRGRRTSQSCRGPCIWILMRSTWVYMSLSSSLRPRFFRGDLPVAQVSVPSLLSSLSFRKILRHSLSLITNSFDALRTWMFLWMNPRNGMINNW